MFGAKAEIAAIEKRLDVERIMVPFDMKRLYEPKHAEVVRINPKRQVPVLIHGELEIFDSTQIFEYFEDLQPEPALWPAGAAARATARLLEHKSDEIYFPPIIRLMSLQDTPGDPVAIAARETASRYYGEMEHLLARRDYLAGSYSYRGYHLLHGATFRSPNGRTDDRGDAEASTLARQDHNATGGAAGCRSDGGLPHRARSSIA